MWDKGYAKATRENILLALRRTRNSYGITLQGMPYVQPVVGMMAKTYRGEVGNIAEVRKPLVRGGDPEVRIQITPGRCAYLFQTAINGYTLAPAPNPGAHPHAKD